MKLKKYTRISNKTLCKHPRVTLSEDTIQLPDGSQSSYLRYDNLKDSACLLVQNSEKEFLILEEYTYPLDDNIYQMPGGLLDAGETPTQAAKRELIEETGYSSNNFTYLGSVYQDHRRSVAKVHLFHVTDIVEGQANREGHEFMQIKWFSERDTSKLVQKNQLQHYGSLAAWALYLNNRLISG